jgi:hypothetical protein
MARKPVEKTKKKKKGRKLPIHIEPGCAWRKKRKKCGATYTNWDGLCVDHIGKSCRMCGAAATHPCTPIGDAKGQECSRFACDVCVQCCVEHGATALELMPDGVLLASKEPRRGLLSENDQLRLRFAGRMFYDLQAMRIATNNRGKVKKGEEEGRIVVDLNERDRRYMLRSSGGISVLEAWALKEVEAIGQHHPMWGWLVDLGGVGPTLAGFILADLNPHRAERPSSFVKFAGLHVVDGRNPHPTKGEKLDFSKRVRSKLIAVLGTCLLQANNETYRVVYDAAKDAKLLQLGTCMGCDGQGVILRAKKKGESPKQTAKREKENANKLAKFQAGDPEMTCWICEGKKEGVPWGRGPAHRHAHANRLMIKAFLQDFWRAWRTACGLPVVPRYQDRSLGDPHHQHGGRYGTIDGVVYTGPAFPDKDGNWPPEYGWEPWPVEKEE